MKKRLRHSAAPGYRRIQIVERSELDGFSGIIDATPEADADPQISRKQRHTAHRNFERLRDEHTIKWGSTVAMSVCAATTKLSPTSCSA